MQFWPEYLKPYKKWFLWCFGISIIAHCFGAWFSLGYFHPDEHFQILEFANAKAGLSPPEVLPWEYAARLRTTLQPWIAFIFIKIFYALGDPDPYAIATALRFLSALFGWVVSIVFCVGCFRWIKQDTGRKALILLSAFLWFLLFVHIRFSSENWSGNFFFLGLGLLFLKLRDAGNSDDKKASLSGWYILLIGLLFGFSVVCRLHNVLLLPGVFLWLWLMAKLPFRSVFIMGLVTLLPLGFNVVLDRMFYGEWVFSIWNYYDANINQGIAARFGVSPWWYYFPELAEFGKVAGALFWVCFFLVLFKRPRNPVIWALIPFILVHILTSHKELRFMFPILPAAPFLLAVSWEIIFGLSANRIYRWACCGFAAFFIWQNSVFMFRTATEPLNPMYLVLRELYFHYSPEKPITILTDKRDMYFYLCGLRMNFYMRPNIDIRYVSSLLSIKNYLKDPKREYFFVYTNKGFDTPEKYKSLPCKPVYYAKPEWLKSVNFNHWVDRTSIMRMCECGGK